MPRAIARVIALLGSALVAAWALRSALKRSPDEQPENDPEPEEAPAEVESPERRRLLTLMAAAGAGASATAIGAPMVAFVVAPMFREQEAAWRRVGAVTDFTIGDTVLVTIEDPSPLAWAGVTAESAAWLRRVNDSEFVAFSVVCTHLGCAVRWLDEPDFFICPCHGAVFDRDGQVAAGPARRPLVRHPVRIVQGQVELQTVALPVTGPIGAE